MVRESGDTSPAFLSVQPEHAKGLLVSWGREERAVIWGCYTGANGVDLTYTPQSERHFIAPSAPRAGVKARAFVHGRHPPIRVAAPAVLRGLGVRAGRGNGDVAAILAQCFHWRRAAVSAQDWARRCLQRGEIERVAPGAAAAAATNRPLEEQFPIAEASAKAGVQALAPHCSSAAEALAKVGRTGARWRLTDDGACIQECLLAAAAPGRVDDGLRHKWILADRALQAVVAAERPRCVLVARDRNESV